MIFQLHVLLDQWKQTCIVFFSSPGVGGVPTRYPGACVEHVFARYERCAAIALPFEPVKRYQPVAMLRSHALALGASVRRLTDSGRGEMEDNACGQVEWHVDMRATGHQGSATVLAPCNAGVAF